MIQKTKAISIRIEGVLVPTREGKTILEAAREAGRNIPTLCHMDGLPDVGACRLCIVEVGGSGRLAPACTTPVQEGLSVTINSPRLLAYRRTIVELLLAERNHVCAVCVSNGHCELQSMATSLGVSSVRFPYRYPALAVDLSQQRYVIDHNRCILCSRCVRVCAEVEGAHVWDIMGRGIHSRVISEMDQPWAEASTCTGCGKCVQACPTGAMAEKGRAVEEMVKRTEAVASAAARKGVPDMSKVKLATIWLDGCSGCHMSLLDLDEAILVVAQKVDLVYSPLVDATEFPEGVDVTLVEGAVSSQEDVARLRTVRARSRIVVALGDCATSGNVPAMRNVVPVQRLLERIYIKGADVSPVIPSAGVPALLPQARPPREFVKIDIHLPGCPPPPKAILAVLAELLEGRMPKQLEVKFG